MTDDALSRTVRAALADADPAPDAELLRRYAAGDGTAFELLVRRHAGLVWAVCRAVLANDRHTAEDAFQAAFLALARKAGTVRGSLPGWLYQVTRRAALRARKASGPRQRAGGTSRVEDAADTGPLTQAARPTDPDLAPLLHAEIDRLGAKFREPLLLVYFQGFSHAEAAARLGWPVGTLASRLSRARDTLRDRLTRRGVSLSVAAVGSALVPPAGAVGPGLVRACLLSAAGPAPAGVVAITEGVLFTMRMAKLKLAAAVTAVGVGLAGTGALVAVGQGTKGGGPPAAGGAKADPAGKPDPAWNTPGEVPSLFPDIKPDMPMPAADGMTVLDTDPPAVKLRKAKFNLLLQQYRLYQQAARQGRVAQTEMLTMSQQLAAATDGLPGAAEWKRWRVAQAKEFEEFARVGRERGALAASEMTAATNLRVEAELALVTVPPGTPVGQWTTTPARRRPADMDAARKRLELLKLAVRDNQELIEAGNWQVTALSNLLQVQREMYEAAARVYGDSPELVAEAVAIEKTALDVETSLGHRYAAGTLARQDLHQVSAHRQWIKGELAELRARAGIAREYDRQRLKAMEAILKPNQEIVATGRADASTWVNLVQLQRDTYSLAAQVYGETPELLAYRQKRLDEMKATVAELERRLRDGKFARAAVSDMATFHVFQQQMETEQAELKARLGK